MLGKGPSESYSLARNDDECGIKLRWPYAVLLGVMMKLGGCTVNWNYGLIAGFWHFFVAILFMGMGYIILGLCMSEMVSIMSFSGGYYGYARCAIGPYIGFLTGCCSIFENTFQYSISVMKIAQFCTLLFNTSPFWEPIWWLCTFVVVIACHLGGMKWLWTRVIPFTAIIMLLLIGVYLLGSIPALNFSDNVIKEPMTSSGNEFFNVFRLAALFFMGFDMLTLTSNHIEEPRIGIPRAMLSLIAILFLLSLWLLVTVSSQSPGVTTTLYQHSSLFPLAFGYVDMFHVSYQQALCFSVIPSFGTCIGYSYVLAKQVHAMAKSGLLPAWLKITTGTEEGEGTPLFALLAVMVFAACGLFYAWAVDPYMLLTRLTILAGCVVYLCMFTCYIVFKTRFSNLERKFRSPLGITGAVIGIAIFGFTLIVLIFFHREEYQITIVFLAYVVIMSLYYYYYAEVHQTFSATEQKVFFKAYIVNMKRRKKQGTTARIGHDIMRMFRLRANSINQVRVYATSDGQSNSSLNSSVNSNEANSLTTAGHHLPSSIAAGSNQTTHLHHSSTDRTSRRLSGSVSISVDRYAVNHQQNHLITSSTSPVILNPHFVTHYVHATSPTADRSVLLAPSVLQESVAENGLEESSQYLQQKQPISQTTEGNEEQIVFPKSTKLLIKALTAKKLAIDELNEIDIV